MRPYDLDVHLLRRHGLWAGHAVAEAQPGMADPDEVGRRIRDRAVDAKDRELNPLSRPDVAADDQAVGSVPPADDRSTDLPLQPWKLAVDPYLRVVVERRVELNRGAGRIVRADPLGNRDADAIPVEREPAVSAPACQVERIDDRPSRVVEVRGAGARRVVVGAQGRAGRLAVRAWPV